MYLTLLFHGHGLVFCGNASFVLVGMCLCVRLCVFLASCCFMFEMHVSYIHAAHMNFHRKDNAAKYICIYTYACRAGMTQSNLRLRHACTYLCIRMNFHSKDDAYTHTYIHKNIHTYMQSREGVVESSDAVYGILHVHIHIQTIIRTYAEVGMVFK
jgi:hypothetical protein